MKSNKPREGNIMKEVKKAVADKIAAEEIEAKKTVRETVRKAKEAVEAVELALEDGEPYDLICLDIMMPEMDGYTALERIRRLEIDAGIEENMRSKVIMTTALTDGRNVQKAFQLGCVAYAGKPIDPHKFEHELKKLSLI